jgi:hypothetical protein
MHRETKAPSACAPKLRSDRTADGSGDLLGVMLTFVLWFSFEIPKPIYPDSQHWHCGTKAAKNSWAGKLWLTLDQIIVKHPNNNGCPKQDTEQTKNQSENEHEHVLTPNN